jgi:hypothetical protein
MIVIDIYAVWFVIIFVGLSLSAIEGIQCDTFGARTKIQWIVEAAPSIWGWAISTAIAAYFLL